MDFIKLIRSLEELLYEVMSWLVFYPRTLWAIVARPEATADYAEAEQRDAADEQYIDTLSPPLLLMLSVLLAHAIELGLGAKGIEAKSAAAKALFGSEQNLLMLRSLLFALFPLVAAARLLRRKGVALDRKTLRAPFFGQCYLTAPLVLTLSVGLTLARIGSAAGRAGGLGLLAVGVAWYLRAQTGWQRRRLETSAGRAVLAALVSFLLAWVYFVAVAAADVLFL